MDYQILLIAFLIGLVVALAILLTARIRREKRRLAATDRMNLADFGEFLRSNSLEGTIQVVAGRVSEYLKSSFDCERIVFLRKQRNVLELNYYHGIRGFRRHEFRINHDRRLTERMQETMLPQPLDRLVDLLPESFINRLRSFGIDTFFPVFWRDNLYGVYFVKSSMEMTTPAFGLLVGGLAHSLAAAYHIKWHETRYKKLEEKTSRAEDTRPEKTSDVSSQRGILKLVRHRNSESLVPKIMESVQKDLGLSQVLYVYEPKRKDEALLVWNGGITGSIEPPTREGFNELNLDLKRSGHTPVQSVSATAPDALIDRLREAGLKYMTSFPLTPRRSGILAWTGNVAPQKVSRQLALLEAQTTDLIENAESYERVEEMSYTDNLTGLANQRYFHKRLKEEIDRAKRYQRSLALIIFDMDDLKSINDTYGHLAGDAVLRRLGQILKNSIRAIDIIARYGGDEFCIIMPEADGATCTRFMDRLQVKIASSKFSIKESESDLNCTVSLGGAIFPDHGAAPNQLIAAADAALLTAKELGRNKSLLFDTSDRPKTV